MLDRLIGMVGWSQRESYNSLEIVLQLQPGFWERLLSNNQVQNYVIVSTCNRLEIYYSPLVDLNGLPSENGPQVLSGSEAIKHLFQVTAGLDSMSIGENEILHQVKDAFDASVKSGHAHGNLALIFRRAITSGKLVRKNTDISRGKVSIPALSIDILDRSYGIRGKRVAVVGTGKMAVNILNYVKKLGAAEVTVVGRTEDKTISLSKAFDAIPRKLAEIDDVVENNDVIITATSSKDIVLSRHHFLNVQGNRAVLDISNPRNVEEPYPGDNYDLIDMKALTPILENNRATKEREVVSAERIAEDQTELLISRLSKLEIENLISHLYRHGEDIKKNEISRLKKALASGTDFDKAIESMTTAIVKKLLASQTEVLRNTHGTRLTGDIRSAIEEAYFGRRAKTSSKGSQDHQESQNQPDQTPQ